MPFLIALAAAAAAPQPDKLQTFKDWTVGCDNVRHCEAVALVPDGEDRDAYLMLTIERDAGPAALARLSVPSGDARAGTRLSIAVDGREVRVGENVFGQKATLRLFERHALGLKHFALLDDDADGF